LFSEREQTKVQKVYPHQIDLNCFPHGGSFLDNGYTSEEMKLIQETHKILNDNSFDISPTVVRIPVIGGHSESVYIEFEQNFAIEDLRQLLEKADGIVVQDDTKNNIYPMPLTSHSKNEVFVGRIRQDLCNSKACQLWIVADNIRKGAATNAVQIAKYLQEHDFLS
jgi:aspartate-semialdehyde dehydrogenase